MFTDTHKFSYLLNTNRQISGIKHINRWKYVNIILPDLRTKTNLGIGFGPYWITIRHDIVKNTTILGKLSSQEMSVYFQIWDFS